jgi:methylated-DNA-[protein]-cysteine S-methyltransferase
MSCLARVTTPIGDLLVAGTESAVTEVCFADGDADSDARPQPRSRGSSAQPASAPVLEAAAQLAAYFDGSLVRFDLPLTFSGPHFHARVWDAVRQVPYGETRTYGEIAATLGRPGAARAVGAANGRNPLPIIVPCHRLIGADGGLTGYGGGLARKRWLLDHESRVASAS